MAEEFKGLLISDDEDMPRALAQLFVQMTADNQAKFFDELVMATNHWGARRAFQWRSMEQHLTLGAKTLINEIKDHTDDVE